MDVETIRSEVKDVGASIVLFTSPENILKRFEYLLRELDKDAQRIVQKNKIYIDQKALIAELKQKNSYLRRERGDTAEEEISNRDGQIKELQRIIKELKEELDRQIVSDALTPLGMDLKKLNEQQAKEIRLLWDERDKLKLNNNLLQGGNRYLLEEIGRLKEERKLLR